jgi:DNA-binding response OmpR family regulator
MNILVLENDPKELTIIQQALSGKKHNLITVTSSLQAWEYIQAGDARFVLASWETSDAKASQFIEKVRHSTLSHLVYILLITSKNDEELPPSGVDDTIRRPIKMTDLKHRVAIAERIISLLLTCT